MRHTWQHYRDKTSQMDDREVLRLLYKLLTLNTTAYILSCFGAQSADLYHELYNNPESRKLARDALATALYIVQSEKTHVPRNWFLGLHPGFDEVSPADLFRLGRADEVTEHLKTNGRVFFALSV